MDVEDIQFVESRPSQDYFCPVCLEILEDPFQMQCCGSHVCRNCSNQLKRADAACFFCRKNGIDASEDKYFKRQVLDIRVRCYYCKAGCKWEGELRDLSNHVKVINPEPLYAICACGCGQKMQICKPEVQAQCTKIPIACIYCSLKHDFNTLMSKHLQICEKYPVECPNLCQKKETPKFMRQHLKKHLEQLCSNRVIYSNPLAVTFAENQSLVAPLAVTMTHFSQYKKNNSYWCSPSFLTSKNGYTIQLRVYSNGYSIDSNHVSLFAFVMKGIHDSDLQWPLCGEITVEVLNWRSGKDDYRKRIIFLGDGLCHQVTDTQIAPWGKGHNEFLSHALLYKESVDTQYLCHDCLCFRVGNFTLSQHTPQIIPAQDFPDSCKPPLFAFMVPNFTKHKETKSRFYSSPFYTSSTGYKFSIGVDAATTQEKSHIGLYARLMKGRNDESLDWPCCVDIFIKLVNWRKNNNHYSKKLCISNQCEAASCQIVFEEVATRVCGFKQFIAHSALTKNASSGTQYLQNDCLYFRVDEVVTYSIPPVPEVPLWLDRTKSIAVVTMNQFSLRKKFDNIYHSIPFLTHSRGYNIQLKIHANGNDEGRGSHVSLYVVLNRGEHDNTLQWPFRADIEVEVLNWREDKQHQKHTFHFNEETTQSACCRITENVTATSWGTAKMIAHSALSYNSSTNTKYLENDCLCFRVKGIAIYSTHTFPKIPIWQTLQVVDPALQFSLFHFSKRKQFDNEFFGPTFYSHKNGYKMRLCIQANGSYDGKSSHISVFAILMKGENDANLHWPFQGDIVVEIMNWKHNQNHHRCIIPFHGATPDVYCSQVTTGEHGSKWGQRKALSHVTLYNPSANVQYLLDDSVLFKVTEVAVYSDGSANKIPRWQVSNTHFQFTVNYLHKRIRLENTYYSAPFYTHTRGYKMRFEVKAAGERSGKGTHVSVYVRLLKGEYDDELEWPLRADIAVELLNWWRDSDHDLSSFCFDYNSDNQCIDRVVGDAVCAKSCWGFYQFVSHSTLFTNPNKHYLEDGCLRFRIKAIGEYSTASMLENKIPRWQCAKQALKSVFQFTVTNFSTRKQLNNKCHSHPFYTDSKKGYKMRLEVYANGYGSAKGKGYVSIYARLLKGQFDKDLSWPVRVELSVQVLNWLSDKGHQQQQICFRTANANARNRLSTSEAAEDSWGHDTFILLTAASKTVSFIEDDCMCIRVKSVISPHWWS